jgi:hypothetical protein
VKSRRRSRRACQTSEVQADRVLALAVILAVCTTACTHRPSAELVFEEPEPTARDGEAAAAKGTDARVDGLCAHSFAVLAGESPSLRSAAIERDFIERCIAGNQAKRSELGEQRWTERAGCIEQAQTSEDIGRCDGRTPRLEPNPTVSVEGIDGRKVCEHIFDILLGQDPGMSAMFTPEQMGPLIDDCAAQIEVERVKDPITFEREAQCLMAAQTTEAFEACNVD